MEFSEDSIDRTLVFKGKRSKRPRQFMAVAMVASTSSTGDVAGGASGGDDVYNYSSSIQYSATTSTTQISTSSSTTEEDEDMANCLILLAQSGHRCNKKLQVESSTERKMVKISSRKFTEMATTTTGSKAGFYVYECKTCNRTFPSFQALGGHRTSHKKIKTEEKKSTADSISQTQDHDHHQQQQEEKFNRIITPSISTEIVNKGKIHECSICGAEFSSGQALGGHMRRHRPPTITTTNTKVMVHETSNISDSSHDDENSIKERPKIFLSLDLNLPASPEDDHHLDTNFVFSAATLVDCHY